MGGQLPKKSAGSTRCRNLHPSKMPRNAKKQASNQTCQHTDQGNKTGNYQETYTKKQHKPKESQPKTKTCMYTLHETSQTDKTAMLRKLTTQFLRATKKKKKAAKQSLGENHANSQVHW